jgi:hypothetical protein
MPHLQGFFVTFRDFSQVFFVLAETMPKLTRVVILKYPGIGIASLQASMTAL